MERYLLGYTINHGSWEYPDWKREYINFQAANDEEAKQKAKEMFPTASHKNLYKLIE